MHIYERNPYQVLREMSEYIKIWSTVKCMKEKRRLSYVCVCAYVMHANLIQAHAHEERRIYTHKKVRQGVLKIGYGGRGLIPCVLRRDCLTSQERWL
jgi:hypothetical protein